MAHFPVPGSGRERLEDLTTDQLFGLFAFYAAKKSSTAVPSKDLAEAWGLLFSGLYLAAEELVSAMQSGDHRLSPEREETLTGFIRADCHSGGAFVLAVARSGGKIDRAALIMLANLSDLGSVSSGGSTALHLLAAACDRRVRPVLIERAGKTALSGIFDARGVPVLFTILGLSDITRQDIAAVEKVFSKDEMRAIKCRNRAGRNGLQMYTEVLRGLKTHEPRERNAFAIARAVKNTKLGGSGMRPGPRNAARQDARHHARDVMGESTPGERALEGTPDISERYGDLTTSPLDTFGGLARKKGGT